MIRLVKSHGAAKPGSSPWTRLFAASARGYSFVELLIVTTIILILASAVQPLARVTIQRQKEAELRRVLRELKTGSEGYPPTLETLVQGVSVVNDASGRKLKFLRRVPVDPMTGSTEWGMRSYQDKPDSTRWGGQNVYDVFSLSSATALDGTKYNDW
jgi:general secretion pathway protein G